MAQGRKRGVGHCAAARMPGEKAGRQARRGGDDGGRRQRTRDGRWRIARGMRAARCARRLAGRGRDFARRSFPKTSAERCRRHGATGDCRRWGPWADGGQVFPWKQRSNAANAANVPLRRSDRLKRGGRAATSSEFPGSGKYDRIWRRRLNCRAIRHFDEGLGHNRAALRHIDRKIGVDRQK